MESYYIFLIAALFLVIAEMLSGSLYLLGFAFGMAAVGGYGYYRPDASVMVQLMLFAAVSLLAIYILRLWFAGKNDVKKTDTDVNQY